MTSIFEAAWVIARRDFIATVYSRTFILFLLVPLVIFAAALFVSQAAEADDRSAAQPVVAVVADSFTVQALNTARARLVTGTWEEAFPRLRAVDPAENVGAQAGRLLADQEGGYSGVFSGTLDRPVLTGPRRIDERVGQRVQLIVDEARRDLALDRAGVSVAALPLHRVVTAQAAGNLQMIRRTIARTGQTLIFMVTVLLATLLLSNMAEEKSNKVIEVLAAAVPLDAVFVGKLIAMLGISIVGLALWGGMLGVAFLLGYVRDFFTIPEAGPAIGWAAWLILLLVYYCMNYLLLGALFLGIGGQASNIREIQTLSMPVTMLQVLVFFLAMRAVGSDGGMMTWAAYIVPFSSPLAMVAYAAEEATLWPHAVALLWQALWVVIIIRLSARMFRATVLKSGSSESFFSFAGLKRAHGK